MDIKSNNEKAPPRVSIGMPVYNEAAYLKKTISSLLGQDFADFELIISDNASTDGTGEICKKAAATDSRIKFHSFEKNQGVRVNFQKTLDMAGGQYFMWAAGHDLWSKNYISSCLKLLDTHPKAVLAFGSSAWIGPDDKAINKECGWYDTRGMSLAGRFFCVFWGNMHPIYGLIRKKALMQSLGVPDMVGADLVLLTRLALMGDLLCDPSATWYRRMMRHEATYKEKVARYKSREFQLAGKGLGRLFPLAALPLELGKAVMNAKIPADEKTSLLAALIASIPIRYVVGRKTP
jgi:glycosyltransferase involved in cell wall biosynthesis